MIEPLECYKRSNCCHAWVLSRENAREILNIMGYADENIEALNQYGDERFAVITDTGIFYGSRFGKYTAEFGDYIVDYDGRRPWAVYTPEAFVAKFIAVES